ncbi:replicative DNA helicase [Nocardia yunnanensis]|uniref:Replicative DNA helicase n=1 Tax=Nocardia yunnanensis TaxID=2382165 RepID=A0A386ZEL1_9NOCA|nr:replicative DNA helicase [Nocardia yunnanensis]AYF76071.1 replicative DNA helicase [Nocardia yunnanensis]
MAVVDDRGHDDHGPSDYSDAPGEDFGRQPPHDMAAEQSVLGGMLLSKDAIADVVEVIRPGDFYRPAHTAVYDAILDLYGRGEPADPVTVAATLDRRGELKRIGGAPYLVTLTQTVPTAANAGYYAEIVAEKAILRRLVEAGTRIVQYGYAGADGQDVAEVVDRAQAELYDVTERRSSEDFAPLTDILQPTMDELDSIASRGGISLGVPTGFTELDEITNGLHPGQMIIVAARPGVGKALALDTPLPTPTGWTTMGEVEIGDELLDAQGRRTRVLAATEVMTGRPCYEVEFSDGAVIVADEEHLWLTVSQMHGSRPAIRTTGEIAHSVRTSDDALNHWVPESGGSDKRHIVDVRKIDSVPVRCVEVDNSDHLYLAGPTMIPTHNSTLGMDFMRSCSIKHGMASVIFSLEMSRTEIVMRLLSAEAKIKLGDMRSGRMSDDDWTKLARRMSEISEAPLFVDDSPNLTMMEIRAKARRLKQRHDLRLIVVDYLQLMTSGKKTESRQQEVSEFSRSLKLMAKELEVPVIAISQLNRGPEQRTDKRPMVSDLRESGCLPASTRILRADTGSEITLGELLESGEQPLVWSLDERMRMVARPMVKVFPSGRKEVFRLRLASGRTVDATGNHPFLTLDGWIPLERLNIGDQLAVPRIVREPAGVEQMPYDEVIELAHTVAADGEAIPGRVFSLPNDQVADFLKALWASGAGSIRWDAAHNHGRIEYSSVDRRLIDDLAQLLLRLGVHSVVKTKSVSDRPQWLLQVASADNQTAFLNAIGAKGFDPAAPVTPARPVAEAQAGTIPEQVTSEVQTLLATKEISPTDIGSALNSRFCGSTAAKHSPTRSRLARVAAVLDDAGIDMYATNDVRWDHIVEITSVGEQDVYDGTVSETHNFVAQGISVHNSLEQDADMVILLHRPDAFERDDPRGGEADLILGKHRNGPTATITVAHQLHLSRFVDMARG